MTIKFTSVCLLLTLTTLVSAQRYFTDATVYKPNGEVLNGQIRYQEWFINPEFVVFRASNTSKEQKLYPRDIKKFVIKNEIYESAVVSVNDETSHDLEAKDAFSSERDAIQSLRLRTDTIFLRVLEKGKLSLFYYVDDKILEHYFVQQENERFTELLNLKFRIKSARGDVKFALVKDYITRLEYFMADCKQLISNLEHLEFGIKPLKDIVSKYNTCVKKSEYSSKASKIRPKFFAYSGLYQPMALVNGLFYSNSNLINGKMTVPLGIGIETSIDRALNPLRLGFELNIKGTSYQTELHGSNRAISYDASMFGIHFLPYIKTVFYSKSRFGHAFYYKLGLTGSYYTNPKCVRVYLLPANLFPPENFKMAKTSFGLTTSAGYQINNWFVEARFEPYALNLVKQGEDVFRTVGASILVGYVF